jgi:two-component system, LuxR family, response regulator FixJ
MSDEHGTIFVVDDDPVTRDYLSGFLSSVGMEVTVFGSAQDFLERDLSINLSGACLLADIMMPTMTGFELYAAMKERDIVMPIIFMTAHGDIPMATKALKQGAFDFVEKPFNSTSLLSSVQEALEKSKSDSIRYEQRAALSLKIETLTPREKQILDLLISGQSNKDVAKSLEISHRTIEVHRAHILRKMDVKAFQDLMRRLLFCGLY